MQTDILSVETLHLIDNCARFTLQIEIRIRSQHGPLISEPHSPESNSINRIHCEISIQILFAPWNLSMFNQTLYHSYLFRYRL